MIRLLFTFLGLFMTSMLAAQFCSTPQEPLLERTDANKKVMVPLQRGAIKYIPITFHMVAASNGTGRVTEEGVLNQLTNINASYADQDIKFYIDHLNKFDNDAVFNSPASNPAKTQMRLRKDNNAVNVFITNTADNGGGTPGVVLAYYDPTQDWVVARKSEINIGSSTLAHEVGHFFSLAHPFSGWDCHPFTLAEYTNPVNVEFTIPCDSGGGSDLIELHDRSNCNTSGDRVCDTPEDYNLGLLYQDGCADNTTIMDMNGELINPMTNNFMSYYRNCSSYVFTPNQKSLVAADYASIQRMYIRTGVTPNTTPIVDPVQYITPTGGIETSSNTNIFLDWEDTPGANQYLVIYDRFSSFTNNPMKAIVTSSEYTITATLNAGITYYWKVWPFNESMTMAGYSATQNFKVGTGVGVNDIKEINDFSISPNPSVDGSGSWLMLSSIKTIKGLLEVSDASGHILSSNPIEIPSGINQFPIHSEGLPGGIYFVTVQSASGRLVERMLIMD